jgi:glycosyltransferase involved in cell wall biosynthesis
MSDQQPAQKVLITGGVSVVLPCHNEEANIRVVAEEAVSVFGKFADAFEVIIVDDGCTDQTPQIADGLAAKDPRIKVVHFPQNRGYGAALARGFKAARFRYLFFTDSDRQFKLEQFERLIPGLAKSKMVIGYRESRQDPFHRRLYGRLFSALSRALFGIAARDVNCAFKIFEREIIADRIFISPGALINAELLAVAKQKGITPVEVGVTHFPRIAGAQTGGSLKVVSRAFYELMRLYFHL